MKHFDDIFSLYMICLQFVTLKYQAQTLNVTLKYQAQTLNVTLKHQAQTLYVLLSNTRLKHSVCDS